MRTRWLVAGAAAFVVVGGVAAGTWFFRSGGRVTPVPVDEAVQRYRDTGPADTAAGTAVAATTTRPGPVTTGAPPPAAPGPLPAPGVYVYATTGSDSVDALNGASHTYPAQTTITVSSAGCGVLERWDVAVERREERLRCAVDGGVATAHLLSFHEFFGSGETEEGDCTGDPRPVDGSAGTTWTETCVEAAQTLVLHGQVVGTEPVVVGPAAPVTPTTPAPPPAPGSSAPAAGQTVDAVHVHVDFDDGDPDDIQSSDTWYLSGTDLVVAEQGHAATANPSSVGTVHYHEDYEIHLVSLTPQR